MNTSNYPESSNVYDGLGDFYSKNNDKINAVIWYKKALEILEVPETRKKLKELESKN
jgi:hypothetical protein